MTPKNKIQGHLQDNRFLKRIIVVLLVIQCIFALGIFILPRYITVYTPPDVSKAFKQKLGDVPLETIYGFSRVLWENLNYCENDCSKEYVNRLEQYSSYLTKSCKRELEQHFKARKSSYQFRNRMLVPTQVPEENLFSSDKIAKISNNIWYVKLIYILKDEVRGMDVRDNKMLYPLKVIKSNRPKSVNPLGLEVDCYFTDEGPVLMETKEVTP